MVGQLGNILAPVAQRRDEEGNHVEAVEEIFAEIAAFDLFLQVLVGRRHHAHVYLHVCGGADGLEALLFERAQHLGLRAQAHVADFVEEERAAIGLLKLADLVLVGTGEAALDVAEHFAFDELLGNRGAVDLHEGLGRARTEGVQGVRHQFLAGAAFAIDQDASVGAGHQAELLAQRLDRARFRR